MPTSPVLRRAAGAALLALVGACRGGAPATAPVPDIGPVPLPAPVGASSPTAVAAARADSALHPYTEADIAFMAGMIGHHAQAIVMAHMAPTRGAGPAVQRLAQRIINAQVDEIVLMQTWLADRGLPVPDARDVLRPAGANAHAHDHGAHAMMPGMLSDEQLAQLERARGEEFDLLFLRFMIQHHRGAVTMVTTLFGSHGAGQDETVFRFATDVNVDQATEIARMETMLLELLTQSPSRDP